MNAGGSPVGLHAIFFLDQMHGWAVGDPSPLPVSPGPPVILATWTAG